MNYYKDCFNKVKKEYPKQFKIINSYNDYVDLYNKYQELEKNKETQHQNIPLIDKPAVTKRTPREERKSSKRKASNNTTITINDSRHNSNCFSLCFNKVKVFILYIWSIIQTIFSCNYLKTMKKESYSHSTSDLEEEVKTPLIGKKENEKNSNPLHFEINHSIEVKIDKIKFVGKIVKVNNEYISYLYI